MWSTAFTSGAEAQEGHGSIRRSLEEAKKMIERLGYLFSEDRLRKLVLFSLEKPYISRPVSKGGLQKSWGGTFCQGL